MEPIGCAVSSGRSEPAHCVAGAHRKRCATDKGEGAVCCKGSVKSISSCGVLGGVTITANMESYRPILKHEKEMHRIRHEPQMYEYVPLPGLDRLLRGEP